MKIQVKLEHFLIGVAATVAAFCIIAVGAPYLLAGQNNTTLVFADTALTASRNGRVAGVSAATILSQPTLSWSGYTWSPVYVTYNNDSTNGYGNWYVDGATLKQDTMSALHYKILATSMTPMSDYEVTANVALRSGSQFGVCARLDTAGNGYCFALGDNSDVFFAHFRNGDQNPTVGKVVSTSGRSLNTVYTMKFRVLGNRLYGKYYPASSPEPSSWMIDTIDTEFTSGQVGFFTYGSQPTIKYLNINPILSELNVSLDLVSSPASGTAVIPGTADVRMASYKLSASSGGDVTVSDLTVQAPAILYRYFANARLYVDGVQVGSTISVPGSSLLFSNLGLRVPANGSKIVTLKVSTSAAAPAGSQFSFDLMDVTAGVNVKGLPVAGPRLIFQNETLTASLDPNTPPAQTVAPGSTGIAFLITRLKATGGDVRVNQIRLGLKASGSVSQLTNVTVWRGTTQIGPSTILTPNYGIIVFSTPQTIVGGQTDSWTIRADVPSGVSGEARVTLEEASGVGVGSGLVLSASGVPVVGNTMIIGSSSILWASGAIDTPQETVPPGSRDIIVGRYDLRATNGDVAVSGVVFATILPDYITPSNCPFTNIRLFNNQNQIGTALAVFDAGPGCVATFPVSFTIPGGSRTVLSLYVDVATTAQNGQEYIFRLTDVTTASRTNNLPVSGRPLTIGPINSTKSVVKLLSPNGGEQVRAGQTYAIQWSQRNVNGVSIGYSTCSSCLDWIDGAYPTDAKASTGTYQWTVPDNFLVGYSIPFPKAFRIVVTGGNMDESDGDIYLVSPSFDTPSIVLLSPNGGEKWEAGKVYEVKWGASNVPTSNTDVYFVLSVFSSSVGRTIAFAEVPADLRSYQFAILKDAPSASDNIFSIQTCRPGGCLLPYNPYFAMDKSDGPFSIVPPTTAYLCSNSNAIGNNQFVGCVWKWQDNNTTDPVSVDSGTPAGDAPAGPVVLSSPVPQTATALSFDWPYPAEPSINQYAGKDYYTARWRSNFTFDPGTYRFTGGADDGIRVRVNGATKIDQWYRGSYHEGSFDMTFNSRQQVQIDVDYFEHIWTGTVKFGWTLASADAQPSVTLLSPRGGEVFQVGDQIVTSWTFANIPREAQVEVGHGLASRVNPFSDVPAAIVPIYMSPTIWTIGPDVTLGEYVSYIVYKRPPLEPIVVYSKPFSIVGVGTSSIALLFPNGGETLEVGKTYNLRWSGYGKNVGFQLLSEDGQTGFDSRMGNLPQQTVNDGSESWTISSVNPGKYRIKIFCLGNASDNPMNCDFSATNFFDMSDAPFSIVDGSSSVITPLTTIADMQTKAIQLKENKLDAILSELQLLRNLVQEQQTEIKYLKSLTNDLAIRSSQAEAAIKNFITYGVDENTKKLGAGERAAVMHSYKSAFDKLPETEEELTDAIKIANGRWPSEESTKAEARASKEFKKIYGRNPNLQNPNDDAAVTIMAYGLRQRAENRNLRSEAQGIITFKWLYNRIPSSTEDWNIVQAITYSGAKR